MPLSTKPREVAPASRDHRVDRNDRSDAQREATRPPDRAQTLLVMRRSARLLLHRLPHLTDRVVALVQDQEPSYRGPRVDTEALWQEVHRSLRNNVGCLIDPRGMRDPARHCSRRIGSDRARQGLPLDALQHAFRLGGGVVWEELLETASRQDPESMRLLVHVAGDVWNFVDEHCSLAAEAYRRAEREMAWRRENRIRLMTEALLHGTVRVADLPDVVEALGLPENGRYAVVAVGGPGRAALRTGPAGDRLVWHPGDPVDLAIARLEEEPGDHREGERGVEALARDLAPGPGGPPVRVGVSPPVRGLVGLGEARSLAEKALQTCPADGEVALLRDHLAAALLVSSPDLGAVLTERVLGPLRRLDPGDREILLDTLAAWLECDASAQRTGERLSCHRNTVLNRLRRYEKLTGRSLSSPKETAELSLALTARRVLEGCRQLG
ncbi:CdaR family transcriptional regulator [Streptomyces sp. ST2-7A]|uniref:PucR family transcriptional regulator n=1 Tax=Streptomyces sp. ST2-7A TaxID=2907214 RepID=UPI001F366AFE|nr:helix-turn-helix domain-containing protein [Streptomyces sp. ST2-7A]MCE7079120.1 helix-turn-helix domain-containing protein [Streptomyces sp. ST2-7A]